MIAEKRELFVSFLPGCLSCRVIASMGRYVAMVNAVFPALSVCAALLCSPEGQQQFVVCQSSSFHSCGADLCMCVCVCVCVCCSSLEQGTLRCIGSGAFTTVDQIVASLMIRTHA